MAVLAVSKGFSEDLNDGGGGAKVGACRQTGLRPRGTARVWSSRYSQVDFR